MDILFSWIGTQDFNAIAGNGDGPICAALKSKKIKRAILISNSLGQPDVYSNQAYAEWLKKETSVQITIEEVNNDDPTDIDKIFKLSESTVIKYQNTISESDNIWFHLSPGTWAMSLSWFLLSQKSFPANLIKSNIKDNTVSEVEVPFEVSVQWLSKIYEKPDKLLKENQNKIFGIKVKSQAMERLLVKAAKYSSRNLPIYIEGEQGTEKVELAKAIHEMSPRKLNNFIHIDCGLYADSEHIIKKLFGGEDAPGHAFEKGKKGTIFIQSIDAMPKDCQRLLLAHLERLKNSDPDEMPRVIVSSRENLMNLVETGNFLEELMHEVSILMLKVPPLRDRGDDIEQIIINSLEEAKKILSGNNALDDKKLSQGALNYLLGHTWSGNMNELKSTLQRMIIQSDNSVISENEAIEAVFSSPTAASYKEEILNRSITDGIDLPTLLSDVVKHYVPRAFEEANYKKGDAAKLLGLPSQQTLDNWCKKHEV